MINIANLHFPTYELNPIVICIHDPKLIYHTSVVNFKRGRGSAQFSPELDPPYLFIRTYLSLPQLYFGNGDVLRTTDDCCSGGSSAGMRAIRSFPVGRSGSTGHAARCQWTFASHRQIRMDLWTYGVGLKTRRKNRGTRLLY